MSNPPIAHATLADCTGVILAGGHSIRFGAPKADAIWRGRSLIGHVAASLARVCPRIIAVARPGQVTSHWAVDSIVHDDMSLPAGPLRGLIAGLSACPTRLAAVASCDAPCVNPDIFRLLYPYLIQNGAAAIPEWNGHLQPLVALYATKAVGRLRELLQAGEQSIIGALEVIGCRRVPDCVFQTLDPQGLSFVSVNTPEDMATLSGTQPPSA